MASKPNLMDRYNRAENFKKPTVLKVTWNGVTPLWATLGPGHRLMGCDHATFEEAIKEAIDGHRQ